MNRVDRYSEELLDQRRPQPFRATEAEAAQLRTAIDLIVARSGAADPDPDFLAALEQRLAGAASEAQSTDPADSADEPASLPRQPRFGRRRLAITAAVAAGAAAGAVAVDRLVGATGQNEEETEPTQETLHPDGAQWQTVLASENLPEGGVHEFDLGSVAGFVQRTATGLRAVSAVCTHQGCRLQLRPATHQLACPCHDAVFAMSGEIVHYQLSVELAPLPLIEVRESEGAVQVFVPR
jgi:nitrite reductase/ring-hydroxylating ferredoxin subunit